MKPESLEGFVDTYLDLAMDGCYMVVLAILGGIAFLILPFAVLGFLGRLALGTVATAH